MMFPSFLADWKDHIENFWNVCQTPYHIILASLALALVIYLWVRLRRYHRFIRIAESAVGKVNVCEKALVSLVKTTCLTHSVVTSPKVNFHVSSGQLNTSVKVKFAIGTPVAEAAQKLQHHIQTTLHENLGENLSGTVDILVSGFTGEPTPTSSLNPLMSSLDQPEAPRRVD